MYVSLIDEQFAHITFYDGSFFIDEEEATLLS